MKQELRIKNQKSKINTIIHDSLFMIRKAKGFTLIELLIVIAIIGILSVGLITAINPVLYINRAKDSEKLKILPQIKNGLEIYYNLKKYYPASLSELLSSNIIKALPVCTTTTDPACFIYAVSPTGEWAVTFVNLSVAKEPGVSSRCSLEAIGCLPVNYNKGNWACAVSGSVKCSDVASIVLPDAGGTPITTPSGPTPTYAVALIGTPVPTVTSAPIPTSTPITTPTPTSLPGPCNAAAVLPTQNEIRTVNIGGINRTFKVHYPTGYNKTATPLVLNFHGSGWYGWVSGTFPSHESYTYMTTLADENGFIVVYPQALSPELTWNGGDRWIGTANDMAFVDAILTNLQTNLCINTNKVYAAGFSAGGMLAYRLACERGDKFAAIAAVSAVKVQTVCNSPGVPLLHIHYIADPIVPFGGGGPRSLPRVWDDSVLYFHGANQCSGSGTPPYFTTPPSQDSIACYNYSPCAKGEVELCIVFNNALAVHSWPKGVGLPSNTTTQFLDASRRIWDFFKNKSLP